MKDVQVIYYKEDLVLCNVETDEENPLLGVRIPKSVTNIRVKAPALLTVQKNLEKDGFFHADRMIRCTINLKRSKVDYKGAVRLRTVLEKADHDRLYEIAVKSFPVDRRFHVNVDYDDEIQGAILKNWIDQIDECYVCYVKDEIAGFAAVTQNAPDVYEIRLAAVDEKYRLTGAAVSLYSFVADDLREKGAKQLYGWISSVNMAVMNLYEFLGASYSQPMDIFLKQTEGKA